MPSERLVPVRALGAALVLAPLSAAAAEPLLLQYGWSFGVGRVEHSLHLASTSRGAPGGGLLEQGGRGFRLDLYSSNVSVPTLVRNVEEQGSGSTGRGIMAAVVVVGAAAATVALAQGFRNDKSTKTVVVEGSSGGSDSDSDSDSGGDGNGDGE